MRSFASSFRRAAGPVLLLAAITSTLLLRPRAPDSPPPVARLALKAAAPGKSPPLWEELKNKALGRGVAAPVPERITVFPDVSAWTEGESVRLPLGDGRSVAGRVNLVRTEGGVLRVAGGITSGPEAGGFSFGLENGRLEGSTIFKNVDRAVLYAGDAAATEALETTASELMCRNYPVPPEVARSDRGASTPDGPMAAPIQLSSRPGAAAVLYLDFDGATVSDADWNNGATILASASGLTDSQISAVWRRVREDFISFNVDVTTIESRYTNAAVGSRMRCIITRSDAWYNENDPFGAGGVAYRNSFNRGGAGFSATIPCWAFSNLFNDPQDIAEVVSHELGHTVGLAHDGTTSEEYYRGHSSGAISWAPIMGAGYDRSVVQWSRGEYSAANNREDDLAIISGPVNGFGYVPDEAGGTLQTAAVLPVVNTVVNQAGLISNSGDSDVYQFQSSGGNVNLTIRPYSDSPNLDIAATLETASGVVLTTANPAGPLEAVISTRLTTSGVFFLRIAGSGSGSASTGYTSYGSIGDYTITGTVPTAPPEIVVEVPSVGGIESGAGASIGDVVSGGSRSLTFTIRNSGVGNLIELALTKTGTNAADFTVSAPPVQTVDPGATTQFTVSFAPRETGAKSALIRLASNDPDENPFEIPITANGIPAAPPDIIVANASGQSLSDGEEPLVLGNSLVGISIRRAFTIRNDGLAPLTGITVTKDGANPADFTITQPVMTALNFGQRTTFEVSFNPPALGTRTASLHVQSNDPDEAPFDIPLTAAGVSSGATDSALNARLTGKVYATAEQPDGKIIVGGDFTSIGGGLRTNIARLNPDGSLDESFVCSTNDFVYCLAVQPDGRILLGGQFYAVNEIPRNRLARVNADGSLDNAFNPDAGGYVYSLGVLPDGKIMAGGAFYQIGGQGRANVARLNSDGSADPGFSGGVNDYVYCLAVQDDGKVVIGGGFSMHGTVTRNRVARLTATGALDTGFNLRRV